VILYSYIVRDCLELKADGSNLQNMLSLKTWSVDHDMILSSNEVMKDLCSCHASRQR